MLNKPNNFYKVYALSTLLDLLCAYAVSITIKETDFTDVIYRNKIDLDFPRIILGDFIKVA